MFNDLREFLKKAEELGQVNRVVGSDWDLEVGNITDLQQSIPDAPLLLFDNIKGYPSGYRIATDCVNNELLMDLAMGFPLDARGLDVVKHWKDRFRKGIKPTPPLEVNTGPVLENVHVGEDVNLLEFPVPRWHENDGGRYIGTGDLVIQRGSG